MSPEALVSCVVEEVGLSGEEEDQGEGDAEPQNPQRDSRWAERCWKLIQISLV